MHRPHGGAGCTSRSSSRSLNFSGFRRPADHNVQHCLGHRANACLSHVGTWAPESYRWVCQRDPVSPSVGRYGARALGGRVPIPRESHARTPGRPQAHQPSLDRLAWSDPTPPLARRSRCRDTPLPFYFNLEYLLLNSNDAFYHFELCFKNRLKETI